MNSPLSPSVFRALSSSWSAVPPTHVLTTSNTYRLFLVQAFPLIGRGELPGGQEWVAMDMASLASMARKAEKEGPGKRAALEGSVANFSLVLPKVITVRFVVLIAIKVYNIVNSHCRVFERLNRAVKQSPDHVCKPTSQGTEHMSYSYRRLCAITESITSPHQNDGHAVVSAPYSSFLMVRRRV